jgi:hypothetical protein
MGVRLRKVGIAVAVLFLAAVTASSGSAGARKATHGVRTYSTRATLPLRTSVTDPFTLTGAERAAGFQKAKAAGASYVRIVATWSAIAPSTPPAGFDPADPTSLDYSWGWLDSTVEFAKAAGLTPILDIVGAPGWAQTTRNGERESTPKITALGQFAKAFALHYDGSHGAPAVHIFQVWNEPNLSQDLSPVNAATYRSMVNAVAASIHAVSAANLVVAGGLDPFGHAKSRKQSWNSVAPLTYMRSLLCVSGGKHPHRTCSATAHFDVWAHNPYTFNGPFGHARNPNDVSLGDLPKMKAVLQTAEKLHRIVSSHGVQFWATEFSWDTKPPRVHAAPAKLAARWTSEALYQMWHSGVSLVTWFGLEDKGGKSPYQSGLYYHAKSVANAKAKPGLTAFRFPFVAYLNGRSVSIWGRNATSDKQMVTIQLRHGSKGHWTTVAKIRSNSAGIFKATLRLAASKKDSLRATAPGSGSSLAFSLTRPSPKLRYGPWGN